MVYGAIMYSNVYLLPFDGDQEETPIDQVRPQFVSMGRSSSAYSKHSLRVRVDSISSSDSHMFLVSQTEDVRAQATPTRTIFAITCFSNENSARQPLLYVNSQRCCYNSQYLSLLSALSYYEIRNYRRSFHLDVILAGDSELYDFQNIKCEW